MVYFNSLIISVSRIVSLVYFLLVFFLEWFIKGDNLFVINSDIKVMGLIVSCLEELKNVYVNMGINFEFERWSRYILI